MMYPFGTFAQPMIPTTMTEALTDLSSQQGFLGFWRSSVAKVRGWAGSVDRVGQCRIIMHLHMYFKVEFEVEICLNLA